MKLPEPAPSDTCAACEREVRPTVVMTPLPQLSTAIRCTFVCPCGLVWTQEYIHMDDQED